MKRSEKQALAFVRNAVNVVRRLSLSRQDGVSRPADAVKSRAPSSFLQVASAFWGKRATCGSHSFGDVFVFPLTEDDLLPRYRLSDRISVPLIHRPWLRRSSFHPLKLGYGAALEIWPEILCLSWED